MPMLALTWWQLALLFAPVLFNLWGIWHASRHEFPTPQERTLWMVLCIFLPFLGGVVYLAFGRKRVVREA